MLDEGITNPLLFQKGDLTTQGKYCPTFSHQNDNLF
jgi:hypothetical protein